VKLGVRFGVAGEGFVPNGRAAFLVNHLKRPALVSTGQSIDFDADRNTFASYDSAEWRVFNLRIIIMIVAYIWKLNLFLTKARRQN
jgi:hypothetical protein